jgi:hypothetical protein
LSFSNCAGFKSGFCFPYHIFNETSGKPLNILELPLIAMDRGINYKNNDEFSKESDNIVIDLMDKIRAVHGLFSALWHNTSFDDTTYPGGTKAYQDMLKLARENNVVRSPNGGLAGATWKLMILL